MNTIKVTEYATPEKKVEIDISEIQEISEQPFGFGDGSLVVTARKTYVVAERVHELLSEMKRLWNLQTI